MAVTTIRGQQVKDGDIGREDLNTTTGGRAVVRKVIAGSNLTISSTGADSGTGDVTINSPIQIFKKTGITLLASSWVSATPDYYTYSDTDIKNSTTIVDFVPDNDSIQDVIDAFIYPMMTSATGTVTFYCDVKPVNDITGHLIIINY